MISRSEKAKNMARPGAAKPARPPALTTAAHAWYLYELWTGLYMLDPVEKLAFSASRAERGALGRARSRRRRHLRRRAPPPPTRPAPRRPADGMIAVITLISMWYIVKHSSALERLGVGLWALQAAAGPEQLQPSVS